MGKPIKLFSPNGENQVLCQSIRVDYMKANGWTEKPVQENKPAKAVKNKGDK